MDGRSLAGERPGRPRSPACLPGRLGGIVPHEAGRIKGSWEPDPCRSCGACEGGRNPLGSRHMASRPRSPERQWADALALVVLLVVAAAVRLWLAPRKSGVTPGSPPFLPIAGGPPPGPRGPSPPHPRPPPPP